MSSGPTGPEEQTPSGPEKSTDGKTWNSPEQIAEHRAMTPAQRWAKTISLSRAALRMSRAERVDER
ncbi:MAG: hypothetical protein H0T19_08285 [Thermoleophilaceae bacterium]|jgi:hypothetical protein|nr:hypothetical protein [Thermoleophilaceae bacterium]